jgi:UDPglucose 6-dehydrogenase
MMSGSTSQPEQLVDAHRVAVIGAGYVGLPTAATLSHRGHTVTLAEHDVDRFIGLSTGQSSQVEEGLDKMIGAGIDSGHLRIVNSAVEAVIGAEFVFLCVETPQALDGSADLTYISRAAEQIAHNLAPGAIIINKSTVPLGTVKHIQQLIGREDVTVVSNPEFLREGSAIADSLNPDRIVVGADNPEAARRVAQLFSGLDVPIVITDTTTSELIKYASNAFLATKLTFVNTMASMCEEVGANADDLLLGIGYDKRIGFEFLRPGPGWGGSCLPKDTSALVAIANSAGSNVGIIRAAIAGNEDQLDRVVDKIRVAVGGELEGSVVGVLGLSFKANTNDRRNSPAISITRRLVDRGAVVKAYDPTVNEADATFEDLEHLVVCNTPYLAVTDAHAVAVLTEWPEFKELDFARMLTIMLKPALVDARNFLDAEELLGLGFTYSCIGRR